MSEETETTAAVPVPDEGWTVMVVGPCQQILCEGCKSVFKWIRAEYQDKDHIYWTFMSVDPVCKIFFVGQDFPKKKAKTFLVGPSGNRLMSNN